MVAQRRAAILRAKEIAALQLRHDEVDEVVDAGLQAGEHDGETVGGTAGEPRLEIVGNRARRADQHAVATGGQLAGQY